MQHLYKLACLEIRTTTYAKFVPILPVKPYKLMVNKKAIGVFPIVPERMVILPDYAKKIHSTILQFFRGTWEYLGYHSVESRKAFVDIFNQQLTSGHRIDNGDSDDRISTLIIRDHCVASVFERRNDQNWIEVNFALYLSGFSSEYIERVRCPEEA